MTGSPLLYAAALAVVAPIVSRLVTRNGTPWQFVVRMVFFGLLTWLMSLGGLVPAGANEHQMPEGQRLLVIALQTAWWLTAAWLIVSFERWIVTLRGNLESKLIQDLLAALVYGTAIFSILGHVLDLPIKGLLATSGALAIIIGLALQNSLGDVFSGIVLNIEKPYRTGDWIVIDDNLQGQVIEINWRATHLLTGAQDVAIVPNSIIAKSKLVNCSHPTKLHGSSLRIRLRPGVAPAVACRVLEDVLLSAGSIVRKPTPSVTIKDLSADCIEFELSYTVADIGQVGTTQNELFHRVQRAIQSAGLSFAPRTGAPPMRESQAVMPTALKEQLIASTPIFASLSLEEVNSLAAQMQRKVFEPGAVIVRPEIVQVSLFIIYSGVLSFSVEKEGKTVEVARLAPGEYFGERGLLTGKSSPGSLTALTRVILYEITKSALEPLMVARPLMAEELSENLSARQSKFTSLAEGRDSISRIGEGSMDHFAKTIKKWFLSEN